MTKTQVVALIPAYSAMAPRFVAQLHRLSAENVIVDLEVACSCVALARSKLLSRMVARLESTSRQERENVAILLLDQDVLVSGVEFLVNHAMTKSCAVTVPIAGADGAVFLRPCITDVGYWEFIRRNGLVETSEVSGRWLTSLGAVAMPATMLLTLRDQLSAVTLGDSDRMIYPFAQAGIDPLAPGEWTSEDVWLCRRLGGVAVSTGGLTQALHLKTVDIVAQPGHVLAQTDETWAVEKDQWSREFLVCKAVRPKNFRNNE